MARSFPEINLEDYHYHLPEEKIARSPLPERDQSKLLVYQEGQIRDDQFYNIGKYLPKNARLIFNNSKVIPARVLLQKPSSTQGQGALIEIFLLEPAHYNMDYAQVFASSGPVYWEVMVGNARKWKNQALTKNLIINGRNLQLTVEKEDPDAGIVKFSWDHPQISFGELLDALGKLPLPPYLHREATAEDAIRYQTVFSQEQGAVAAPTAGLHFTNKLLHQLYQAGISQEFITLHVGAGTFQPIKSEKVEDHPMHEEFFEVNKETLHALLDQNLFNIPVGTTSMRTLESLYWIGLKLYKGLDNPFDIPQHFPYQFSLNDLIPNRAAVEQILTYLEKSNLPKISGRTSIFIVPGYPFTNSHGLVTNFHQPGSTLLLLIAAWTGANHWKNIYYHALNNQYRFLSYGDSSLLLPRF